MKKMCFHAFPEETLVNIYKYVCYPANLSRTCALWARISQDPIARSSWLIIHYGKAHALFHAVRLGPNFINVNVVQALLSQHVILSRYFVQRLLMHFGKYDDELIEMKIKHNVAQLDADRIRAFQRKIKCPWASNLPLDVFVLFLSEGFRYFGGEETAAKGNDMELFHFLSAGPFVINHAPAKLKQNILEIEDLIKIATLSISPRPRPKLKSSDQR